MRFPRIRPLNASDRYSAIPFVLEPFAYASSGGTYDAWGVSCGEYSSPPSKTHSPCVGFGWPPYAPGVTRLRSSARFPGAIDGVLQPSDAPGVLPCPRFEALSFKYSLPFECQVRSYPLRYPVA